MPGDIGGHSVARLFNETALQLIREVVPAPTVHARNLFHLSAAAWDAWAAYDPRADGYFFKQKRQATDATSARETAIAYASYRLLLWRYETISDLKIARQQLDAVMASLCLDPSYTASNGASPADLGNRIGAAVIAAARDDGSREDERYVDPSYRPVNPPLEVAKRGTKMNDPNRWQPLSLARQLSQNNLPIPGNVQTFIGPHWGHVRAFALAPSEGRTPIDPGPPPRLGDRRTEAAYKQAAVEILRYSSRLDPTDPTTLDISPRAMGDNALGTNDGDGHALNPATGKPYAENVVPRADYQRVLAEYWADGPKSETPPGHWNVIANAVADSVGFERKIDGRGPSLDPLEWDVKTYFALNGALHDAAVAAWGLKGFYDTPRPISMIRYMGGKGQSSDPNGAAYHPHGLPLEPGLIEVVTRASSAPGQRHARLRAHVGKVAVRAWRRFPREPKTEASGVDWILGADWVPYQRSTFVTPAFAGYVSGHSTFSRAAAEVLTAVTGSAFFPGGMTELTVQPGQLLHEKGPTRPVTLQWATYRDAADQAGISRLFMGIHIRADDFQGRRIGARCGEAAWALATRYFEGTAD